jgi:UDP-GlcNAc:undecaprenyl-phosphate/decaprenyl-phosphate GlcNAc-1-phosphate transferase
MFQTLILVTSLGLSIVAGALWTYAVRNMARRKSWILSPASHHVHGRAIPRLGGVAVFVTFISFYAASATLGLNPMWREQLPVVLPATMLFGVGLLDDICGLTARIKLSFQVCAAIWLFAEHIQLFQTLPVGIRFLPNPVAFLASLLGTIAWVVLVTNAFNLIDGLDGLAAGATVFSLITLCGLAMADHNFGVQFATLILGGAVLGFLRFNFNPASIFLGDSGSLFLGFMLSGLALQPRHAAAPTFVAIAIPLLSFGVPIVDTCVSVVRRFLGDKPLFSPDKDHIHHRLLKLGLTQRQAVFILYGACGVCSLLSLFLLYPNRPVVGLVLVIVAILGVVGIQSLGYQEFYEISRVAHRWLEQKKVIANDIAIRKTVQALKGCKSWPELSRTLDTMLQIGEFDSYVLALKDGFTSSRELRDGIVVDRAQADRSNGNRFFERKEGAWSFAVDLRSSAMSPVGSFTIGRACSARSMLIDLNLVLTEVRPALSSVCTRLQGLNRRLGERSATKSRALGLINSPVISLSAESAKMAIPLVGKAASESVGVVPPEKLRRAIARDADGNGRETGGRVQ